MRTCTPLNYPHHKNNLNLFIGNLIFWKLSSEDREETEGPLTFDECNTVQELLQDKNRQVRMASLSCFGPTFKLNGTLKYCTTLCWPHLPLIILRLCYKTEHRTQWRNTQMLSSGGIPGQRAKYHFRPLYYEGKVMKSIFHQKYVYISWTTTTRHMVSFIDFYFHFLAKFQT